MMRGVSAFGTGEDRNGRIWPEEDTETRSTATTPPEFDLLESGACIRKEPTTEEDTW